MKYEFIFSQLGWELILELIGGMFGELQQCSSKCASIPYCMTRALGSVASVETVLGPSECPGGISAISRAISHSSKQIRNVLS